MTVTYKRRPHYICTSPRHPLSTHHGTAMPGALLLSLTLLASACDSPARDTPFATEFRPDSSMYLPASAPGGSSQLASGNLERSVPLATNTTINTGPSFVNEGSVTPQLRYLRLRWAQAVTVGEDEQVAARVLQIRDLPPRACLPKACTLTTLSEEPSLREDILIKLSFPLASDKMLFGKSMNDMCDSAVLEVTTPRGDRHKVSGIPQPARGTPVYSRGDLVLGLGAILTAESNPVLLPHADNIDILAFRAVRGYESTAEIAVTISLKTVTAMTQPGVYHVMWCSGQLRSNRLAVAVAP